MKLRNILFLTIASALAMSVAPALIFIGGIIGTELAPRADISTLPVAFMIIGTALSTVPAAMIMQKFGRKVGFLLGAWGGVSANLIAALALSIQSFYLFVFASAMVGFHLAFVQQYRFAAAESVEPEYAGKAISFVLLGGVAAAFIGPELAQQGADWFEQRFMGSFIALSVVVLLALAALLGITTNQTQHDEEQLPAQTSITELFTRRGFLVAVVGGIVAYGVMSFIMTATPISMHVMEGHALQDTARVIQSHVVAMYLPSLVTGMIIVSLGVSRVMLLGTLLLLGCSVIALNGQALMHYWWALVLLGVGWNFLFVGSTTLLTQHYHNHERFRAQAINDFAIFSLQAMASLSAGPVIHGLDWQWVNLLPIPLLFIMFLALLWLKGDKTPDNKTEPV